MSITKHAFSSSGCLPLRLSATTKQDKSAKKKWTPTPQEATTLLITASATWVIGLLLTYIIPEKYSPITIILLILIFLALTTYGFHYINKNTNT